MFLIGSALAGTATEARESAAAMAKQALSFFMSMVASAFRRIG
jgi:hypothetical protein